MRTLVIVPTYNEAANIGPLSERLLALEPRVDVLVVDDASPDGTGAHADEIAARDSRLRVLHRAGPRGYAASSIDGLTRALAEGYDAVCTMDADLSHDPAVIPRLVEAVSAGADLAVGSRYVEGGGLEVDWGPIRRSVSSGGSRVARRFLALPVHDCTSGFRCYSPRALETLPLALMESDGYCFLVEVLNTLRRAGVTNMTEVPIVYVDRQHGSSKISKRIVLEAAWRTTGWGLARVLRAEDRSVR